MKKLIFIFFVFLSLLAHSQEDEIDSSKVYISETIDTIQIEKLAKNPMRASLYSAVLPGLGQIYNEKYWKAPIVWGLLGTGVGFVVYFNNDYQDLRSAYIAELNGEEHQYSGLLDAERLARAQNDKRRERDFAIALTALAYILNVIDATVDAHLYEIRKDKDLSLDPKAMIDPVTNEPKLGLALKFNF